MKTRNDYTSNMSTNDNMYLKKSIQTCSLVKGLRNHKPGSKLPKSIKFPGPIKGFPFMYKGGNGLFLFLNRLSPLMMVHGLRWEAQHASDYIQAKTTWKVAIIINDMDKASVEPKLDMKVGEVLRDNIP